MICLLATQLLLTFVQIQARVLYNVLETSPPSFGLSLLPHLIRMDYPLMATPDGENQPVVEAFPKGTRLDNVKIVGLYKGWGLACKLAADVIGFTPVRDTFLPRIISNINRPYKMRNIADGEEPPSLAEDAGPWKLGSSMPARVVGFAPLDGTPLLSLKPSIVEEQFLVADDVTVGQILKVSQRYHSSAQDVNSHILRIGHH